MTKKWTKLYARIACCSLLICNFLQIQQAVSKNNSVSRAEMLTQYKKVAKSLSNISKQTPDKTDWYLLGVAGYGRQAVFENEIKYHDQWFDNAVGDDTHSVSLINGFDSWSEQPIASKATIKYALKRISKQMNVEEDVLLMTITSHGKVDSIQMDNTHMSVEDIDAKWLRDALDSSGIRWRVLVISACHSGSFIDDLMTPETMIITASHANRVSFGCSNDSTYTYFGRAFLVNSLPSQSSFSNAFATANKEVRKREAKMGFVPSKPQIAIGEAMQSNIAEFEKYLFKNNQ